MAQTNMTPEEMMTLVKRCMTGFSTNNLQLLEGCFHDDYTRHATPGIKGVSSFAEHIADLKNRHHALKDARFEIDDMIAEGDTVAARFSFVGEHVDTYQGIPATGKTISRQQISFFRITNGKISESWNITDMYGMLEELRDTA
jgi:steroid delta-isomerase-like uncharacterized protein